MGDRVTRSPQSRELVRGRSLRQALESGAPPAFVSSGIPTAAPMPPTLAWHSGEGYSEKKNSAKRTSEKYTLEETLSIRRQYLEQLFQGSPDPVIITDVSFRTQCVNQEFQKMFGYTAAEVMGRPIDELIFPEDRAAEAQWIAQCLQRSEPLTLETRRRRKDGTMLEVCVSSAPLLIEGRTVAFYAVYRDISERKRAEALSSALYRIAETASAAQDLQQFFASIHGIVDELMCARNFAIAIRDQASETLRFQATPGIVTVPALTAPAPRPR